jgi:hypothetical protein
VRGEIARRFAPGLSSDPRRVLGDARLMDLNAPKAFACI